MHSIRSTTFLRAILSVDAISTAVVGLALSVFAADLAVLLVLPADLLRQAGLVLIPFAAFVGYLASAARPARAGVWAVVALNAVWVIDSAILLIAGWVAPNGLGYAFVVAQALAVGLFAILEFVALRSLRTAPAV